MNRLNPMTATFSGVKASLDLVRTRIEVAAARSSRLASEIMLVAVTKYVGAEVARWLVELGCSHLAESRPQLLWEKCEALSDLSVDWHLIGHLQRNKAKRTLPLISTMHSLDSSRVMEQIKLDSMGRALPLKLLLEINIAGESNKTGMVASEAESLLAGWIEARSSFPMLSIEGLMGMGSLAGGPDQARREFAALRDLRDEWSKRFALPLPELSMGMSEDFEEAIIEGATMVRIGSILFQ